MKRRMLVVTSDSKRAERVPTSEQGTELAAWLKANGAPSKHVYTARIDPEAKTVTVYRFAEAIVPDDGITRMPCLFVGYQAEDGGWVPDVEWGGPAMERPTTHPYQTPPPPWVQEVAYRVEREVPA